MSSLTFNDLLKQVADQSGEDIGQLTKERDMLAKELQMLEERMRAAKADLAKMNDRLQDPVRQAVKAAEMLGIEVPESYRLKPALRSARHREADYIWRPTALPGDVRNIERLSHIANIARAMWHYSRGSQGSVGKNGEGVLSSDEFRAILKEQTGADEVAPGESVTVTLPNGRKLTVTRINREV